MFNEVDTDTPAFAAAVAAVATVTSTTQSAASKYVAGLRSTQFERLSAAVARARSEEHRLALVKISLAQTQAEQALATAQGAEILVSHLASGQSVDGSAADAIQKATDAAMGALVTAAEAVSAVDALHPEQVAAPADPAAAPAEEPAPTSEPAAAPSEAAPAAPAADPAATETTPPTA